MRIQMILCKNAAFDLLRTHSQEAKIEVICIISASTL